MLFCSTIRQHMCEHLPCLCLTIWMWANIHYTQKAHNDFPAIEPAVLGPPHPHKRTHTYTHSVTQTTAGAFITENQQQLAC